MKSESHSEVPLKDNNSDGIAHDDKDATKVPNVRTSGGESSSKTKVEEKGRNLRKKRSAVGSMEDLWDESVFGENSPAQSTSANFVEPAPPPPLPVIKEGDVKLKRSTPVLKISFGTLGQGTVLKIPSKLNGPTAQVNIFFLSIT